MDPLSTALAAVEASQTAKANAITKTASDQAKQAALIAAIAQDATDQATATTQADADVNAAIALLQGMLSTAPAV